MNTFCNKRPLENACGCLPSCWRRGFIVCHGFRQEKSNFGLTSSLEDLPFTNCSFLYAFIPCPTIKSPSAMAAVAEGCFIWINYFIHIICSLCFYTFPNFLSCLPASIVGSIRRYHPFCRMAPTFQANPGLRTWLLFHWESWPNGCGLKSPSRPQHNSQAKIIQHFHMDQHPPGPLPSWHVWPTCRRPNSPIKYECLKLDKTTLFKTICGTFTIIPLSYVPFELLRAKPSLYSRNIHTCSQIHLNLHGFICMRLSGAGCRPEERRSYQNLEGVQENESMKILSLAM